MEIQLKTALRFFHFLRSALLLLLSLLLLRITESFFLWQKMSKINIDFQEETNQFYSRIVIGNN